MFACYQNIIQDKTPYGNAHVPIWYIIKSKCVYFTYNTILINYIEIVFRFNVALYVYQKINTIISKAIIYIIKENKLGKGSVVIYKCSTISKK